MPESKIRKQKNGLRVTQQVPDFTLNSDHEGQHKIQLYVHSMQEKVGISNLASTVWNCWIYLTPWLTQRERCFFHTVTARNCVQQEIRVTLLVS